MAALAISPTRLTHSRAGIAAQDSIRIFNAIKTNMPGKVLAKQWLEVYRQGPYCTSNTLTKATLRNILYTTLKSISRISLSFFGPEQLPPWPKPY